MKPIFFLMLFLLTSKLFSQNLLNGAPTIVKIDADTCYHKWGYSGTNDNDPKHDFVSISYLGYGASLCNQFYTRFYYDIRAQSKNNNYLQMIINAPLIKDSIYEINFEIDPRFKRKKWARGRSFNVGFLNQIYDTLNDVELEKIKPLDRISAKKILADGLANYQYNYKATGQEKCFLLYGQSNKKEDVLFTIEDICLHKKNSTCDNFIKQFEDEKENNIVSNDTINLFFNVNESILIEENMLVLNSLNIENQAEYYVSCIGFADITGNKNDNLNLSLQRALTVQKYLENLYPKLKIKVSAKGQVSNANNLSLNRKVEIIILKQ